MMRIVAVFLFFAASIAAESSNLNDPPPRAALITVGAPDSSSRSEIRGTAQAATPGSTLIAVNLDTGHYAWTRVAADGSFVLPRLFAPRGTSILLKIDPAGREVPSSFFDVVGQAGTILRVPEPSPTDGAIPFVGAAFTSGGLPTVWQFDGSLTHEPGVALRLQGTIVIESPSVDQAGAIHARPQLMLERLTDADGTPVQSQATFSSTVLTPTGLPIERLPWKPVGGMSGATVTLQKTPGRAQGVVAAQFRLTGADGVVKAGFYRTFLRVDEFEGARFPNEEPHGQIRDLKTIDRASRKPGKEIGNQTIYGPIVRIGQPATPRLHWMLLANHLNEGTRGTRAVEDRKSFGFAPRVVTQAEVFIVPRKDRTGSAIRYNLEPFLPAIGIGDRDLPSPPQIPFRFPSGELRAVVTDPDGRVTSIGPFPFVQSRSVNATSSIGRPMDSGGGYPHDPYQLSTMNPAFEVAFAGDGKHTVRLDGWIEDLWGNRWEGRGTYEILVAKPLVLDSAVLPGAHFETGDSFDPSMQLIPPVGADVEVRLHLLRDSDSARGTETVLRGRANRFGHFRAEKISLDARGEYRADIVATWRDPSGELWAGARTWGGVVAPPDAEIVAHGMRGADDMPPPRPIWYRRNAAPNSSGHMHVPFASGDVMWATDGDAAIPHITFEDPLGKVSVLRNRALRFDAPPSFAERYDIGEARPFIGTSTGIDAHFDPASIDVWGYAYRSVQRPLVRVREIIGEESVAGYYWRFNGSYGGQTGSGASGDLVNDFKFQFGGIVLRGPAIGEPQYAIYGSLFVLVPDEGPHGGSRVFPPFRGNGGGSDGGPLMTLKGWDVEMFLHLTGVRPGTILHKGAPIVLSGYVAPTVPALVSITLTSPSGTTTTVEGRANRIGWVHLEHDARAVELGVWTARVLVTFQGPNTSGPMTPPYPTGGVLGSQNGAFHFYVVDADAPELAIDAPASPLDPSKGPMSFTVRPPPGLRDVRLTHTATMPGFILQESSSEALQVVYDAPTLSREFPNLDLNDWDGRGDTIFMSFLLSGTDASGARRHFARAIAIDGVTLHAPPQPAVEVVRRRSVRR